MRQLVRRRPPQAAAALEKVLAGRDSAWIRGRAMVSLAAIQGPAALKGVLRHVGDRSVEVRCASADALALVGPGAEPAVRRLLADKAPPVRLRAVVAFARLKGRGAWGVIEPLLKAEQADHVQAAAEAMVYVRSAEADKRLIELLGHADGQIRASAARALGQAKVARSIPLLLGRMAADKDPQVVAACRETLAAFDEGAVLGPLLAALASDDKTLYPAAMEVICLRPTQAAAGKIAARVRADPARYAEVLALVLKYLAGVSADSYQGLFAAHLSHSDVKVRIQAVGGLARCTKSDLFGPLRPLLTDASVTVRRAAFRALRSATRPAPPGGIVPYLSAALASPEVGARTAAVELLGERLKPADVPAAVRALDAILAGSNASIRRMAGRVLEPLVDEPAARRVAARQGFLTDWRVVGSYPGNLQRVYLPEIRPDLGRKYPKRKFGWGAAVAAGEAACGGVTKTDVLRIAPPAGAPGGKTVAAYWLTLPAAGRVTLETLSGLPDDAGSQAGRLEVHLDGAVTLAAKLAAAKGWQARRADLSAGAGKSVRLDLIVPAAAGKEDGGPVALARAEILADGKAAFDLLKLSPTAGLWVVRPGREDVLTWQRARTTGVTGTLMLHDALRSAETVKVGYAAAQLTSDKPRKVRLEVTSRDGFRAWLNGKVIGQRPTAGQEGLEAQLRAGANNLLVKVDSTRGYWHLSVRVCDEKGGAVHGLSGPQ